MNLAPVVRYRKPPELARLGTRHAVVEASAGTGKTYILEHLVVDLLLTRGASIEQILVVTFTEKATAELGARIRRKLEELRGLGADHANATGARDGDCWLIDDRARQRLGEALLGFDRAAISTIHGFCQRLLTEHAFLHRRLFREEAVAEDEAFATAFAESLRRAPAADPVLAELLALWLAGGNNLAKLRRAIAQSLRGLACLYPPRPEALRPGPLPAERVLAAARGFAALPAGEALKAALKRAQVNGNTIRSFVDKWGELQSLAARCQTPGDVPALLAAVDGFHQRRDKALYYLHEKLEGAGADPEVGRLTQAFRAFEADCPSPLAALVGRFSPVVGERLAANKRQAGRYDFQDMLTLVAEGLAGDGARARALLATLRARHRYALIDEFQDTDEVQWGIFRKIFFDGGGDHVLTVIGDPKQAIYSFRGADVFTYLAAKTEIAGAGNPPIFLTQNFRSTAPLIDAYNAILDQNVPFFRPEGGIRYDHPVVCGRPELALTAGGAPAPAVVVLDVETSAATLLTWQVKRALLARLAEEVKTLLTPAGALAFGGEAKAPVRAGDIYVLTRTTRESREVGQALRAVGVPFAFFKQERLFDTVEARDLLELLRAIADPDDVTRRARAFVTPFFGLGLADLAACDDLEPGDRLLGLLYEWRALAEAGDFEALFARIIAQSGVVSRELFFHESERSLTNTLHLCEILQEEAARARTTIRELCETLGAFIAGTRRPPGEGRDIQRLETEADAVQIMTIHHAKGLEAPVVFLYGGFWPGPPNDVRVRHEDGRRICDVGRPTPASDRAYDAEQDDEEKRVLYVALTRAKGRLYLPRYPAAFKSLRGAYRFINQRLDDLLGGFSAPATRALFARMPVPCPGAALAPPLPATPAVLAAWAPPPALLAPLPSNEPRRQVALARAGFVTTSYTALRHTRAGQVAVAPAALELDPLEPVETTEPDPLALPRGRMSGRFLHALLEELPFASAAAEADPDAWSQLPAVAPLFARLARRFDRDPRHLPAAQRLVHAALTTPLPLGEAPLAGFAQLAPARVLRELEFLYPIPERHHPLLGHDADTGRSFSIGRGLIKGYIDLLFEHEDRVYLCDWKSDAVPDFSPAALADHVARTYALQARLYTLGVVRLCGLADEASYGARFGGVIYAFVRGMDRARPGHGIHFARPSWAEIVEWQDELCRSEIGVAR